MVTMLASFHCCGTHAARGPSAGDEAVESMFEKVAAMLEHFGRKAVRPGCFVVLENTVTQTSWNVGNSSRSGMMGRCIANSQ